MGREATYKPLGQLCDATRGITYGIVKVGEFVPGGVPVIRGGDIRDGKIAFDDQKRVTEEVSHQFQRTILRGGEIVVNLIAEPGHTAIVPPELAGANVSRDVGVIPLNDEFDHRYVEYCLKSPMAVRWLTSRLQGSVTQKINLGTLRDLPIPDRPRNEQRSIANILGTLDDKIELNRRTNETLEAMARALFKSWFVDFDPVRVKAEGRQPSGMDAETAKLFPSELVESELGELPKGWRVRPLGEVMDLKRGYDLPAGARNPGPVPIVSSSGPSGWHDEVKVRGPGVVTGRYGTIGRVFLVREDFWPLNTTLYLRDFKGNDLWYCYYLLQLVDFSKFSDKAAVPGVNRNHLHEELVVAAPSRIQERFAIITSRWGNLAAQNSAQASTLAETRDALLPRLLSGEVELGLAERAAELSV